jgi:hypothetical protein
MVLWRASSILKVDPARFESLLASAGMDVPPTSDA